MRKFVQNVHNLASINEGKRQKSIITKISHTKIGIRFSYAH